MFNKQYFRVIEKWKAILIVSNSVAEQIIVQIQNTDYIVKVMLIFQEAVGKTQYNIVLKAECNLENKNDMYSITLTMFKC